jgi:hypothetical protein
MGQGAWALIFQITTSESAKTGLPCSAWIRKTVSAGSRWIQLAIVNDRNGEVKPQGDRVLTPADIAAIQNWLDNRVALLARRDIDDIHRAVDYLNINRQLVQS